MRSFRCLFVASLVYGVIATANAQESGEQPAAQTQVEDRLDFLMRGDPQTVLRIRSAIQGQSAARQAPIVKDFAEDTPQEVLDLHDLFEVSLQPDQMAPEVILSRYQSTAVTFVDAYGNPWPIRKVSNFLSGLVLIDRAIPEGEEAVVNKDHEGTTDAESPLFDPQAGSFTITALKHGVVGNITVYLHGLSTPISINLKGKAGIFHRLATIRVSDVGPQTDPIALLHKNSVSVGTPADVDLNNALYGVTPVGSEQMVLEGADGKAWLKGDHIYLQTPLAVFSPRILQASHGNGQYRAYKLPKTTTVMGANNEGRTVTLKILRHPSSDIHQQTSLTAFGGSGNE